MVFQNRGLRRGGERGVRPGRPRDERHRPRRHRPRRLRRCGSRPIYAGSFDPITNGQLDLIQHAVIGRSLNIDASIQAINQKLAQGAHTIPLTFDTINPPVTDSSTAASLVPSADEAMEVHPLIGELVAVQNHLLQLLALTAMEDPVSFGAHALRSEKEKVLSAVRLPEDLAASTVRGQYSQGWQGGEEVSGYLQEEGIEATSTTETYAALKVAIDTRRWAGVPFYLRTGKRLGKRVTEIAVVC